MTEPKKEAAAPKTKAAPNAKTTAKPKAASKADAAPKTKTAAKAAPKTETALKAKAAAKPKAAPKAGAAPKVKAATKAAPKAKAAPKTEATLKAKAAPKIKPAPGPKISALPKVKAVPLPKVAPQARAAAGSPGSPSPARPKKRVKAYAHGGQELANLVAAAAMEHKPIDPVLLNMTGLSQVADWFFIASAKNARQLIAIADKIIRRAKEAGFRPLGSEGLSGESHWALVDLGDVVAHIFNHETRAVYDLEGLWSDATKTSI